MAIILIGGSGFVGSRFNADFRNLNVKIFDKINKDLGYNYCDITIPKTLKNTISSNDTVVLLAAEHRDDVTPTSLYYKTNVEGTENVLKEMDRVGCKKIIFTSSVAVYGLNKNNPNEKSSVDPFNHYGKSKLEAENVIKNWYEKSPNNKSVTIIRPTVIFGEKNRGNVYNLFKQIATGRFIMIGDGKNKKSMAYVGNVVSFIKYRIDFAKNGYDLYNYIDKEDLNMNELILFTKNLLKINFFPLKIPIWMGYLSGLFFDFISFVIRKKLPISYVRVKKFVANTQFSSVKSHSCEWNSPFTIKDGLERTINFEFKRDNSV